MKMNTQSRTKTLAKAGKPPKLSDESNRKISKTFSIRQIVVDQLNHAVTELGINQSRAVEKQIVNYLRRLKLWPPRSGELPIIVNPEEGMPTDKLV